MKNSTEDLILAAIVVEMSRKLQDNTQPRGVTTEELQAWVDDNPIEKFIPGVLGMLESIADNIRRLRSQE